MPNPTPARTEFAARPAIGQCLPSRIGFHKGRMNEGAIIAVMHKPDLSALTIKDFSLGASNRWSRSAAAAPWAPEYTKFRNVGESYKRMNHDAIESVLASEGKDVDALKEKVLAFFKNGDSNFPAKVFPRWRHEDWMAYPSAEVGVPQFKLHNKVHWVVRRIILGKQAEFRKEQEQETANGLLKVFTHGEPPPLGSLAQDLAGKLLVELQAAVSCALKQVLQESVER
jgi:hypothetical protein